MIIDQMDVARIETGIKLSILYFELLTFVTSLVYLPELQIRCSLKTHSSTSVKFRNAIYVIKKAFFTIILLKINIPYLNLLKYLHRNVNFCNSKPKFI